MKKEIDEMFENPRFACTNCGAKVHDKENVCAPKEL
jgi:DNA-directed RNA polymerase subunit RPC12/RpoP